jgi:hypothetical protein
MRERKRTKRGGRSNGGWMDQEGEVVDDSISMHSFNSSMNFLKL